MALTGCGLLCYGRGALLLRLQQAEPAVWRFNWTKTDELSSDKTGLPL